MSAPDKPKVGSREWFGGMPPYVPVLYVAGVVAGLFIVDSFERPGAVGTLIAWFALLCGAVIAWRRTGSISPKKLMPFVVGTCVLTAICAVGLELDGFSTPWSLSSLAVGIVAGSGATALTTQIRDAPK